MKIKNLNKICICFAIVFPMVSFAIGKNYPLIGSSRDNQGNLLCTYSNGETINMGQSWSPCPSSIQR